jgi:hypothetical protein
MSRGQSSCVTSCVTSQPPGREPPRPNRQTSDRRTEGLIVLRLIPGNAPRSSHARDCHLWGPRRHTRTCVLCRRLPDAVAHARSKRDQPAPKQAVNAQASVRHGGRAKVRFCMSVAPRAPGHERSRRPCTTLFIASQRSPPAAVRAQQPQTRSARDATMQKRQGHRRGTHSAWPIKNPTLRDQDIKTKTAAVIDALLHR